MPQVNKILIIQTAFIGDVILATALIEKLKSYYPNSKIDFLVRKGNEVILENNSKLNQVLIWNKKQKKYISLIKLIFKIRKQKYDIVINVQRFMSTALITVLSGAPIKSGFRKSPLSLFYQNKAPHHIDGTHEIERNQKLIEFLTDEKPANPKLYLTDYQYKSVKKYQSKPYICISPGSVWFTKQFPADQWVDLINFISSEYNIYLIGGKEDVKLGNYINEKTNNNKVLSLCGELPLLSSAALMDKAIMNYVNDSAPLHICSSLDAPVTAVYCSTIPKFGFGPIGENASIVETSEALLCRPCGLHGKRECPQKHFKCATTITSDQLLKSLKLD